MSVQNIAELRGIVATACRILAFEGLAEGVLGHVSARVDGSRMLLRCRGPAERGLLFSTPDDVRLVDADGVDEDPGSGYTVPNELPIHGEILRTRPEVNAVVHAHPPAVLLCGVTALPLRPVFGAYNIPAMRMALDGVPTYPRSVLIRRPDLAREMIAAMGGHAVCILRGHGITATGDCVQQAVVRALNLNALATAAVEIARLGRHPEPIPPEDVAELPDLGPAFNDLAVWRYHVAKTRQAGF